MAKRHELRGGDWDSAARRLEEIVAAHSGEDAFEELFKLLVVQLLAEVEGSSLPLDKAPLNRRLARAAHRWPGTLESPVETRLAAPELARCVEILRRLKLTESGLFGLDALFENLVSRTSKGAKGQFFTPRFVVREAVRMLDIQPGQTVCDPACGSGAFLIHALGEQAGAEPWGFDMDPRAVRMARVMLAASGHDTARIVRGDSLRLPGGPPSSTDEPTLEEHVRASDPSFSGFDVIATNPPFAGDVGDAYQGGYALARGGRVERDVLFLERCVRLLKPGGRLAIVLPHNKLGSRRWESARRWLLLNMRPIGVVGLGRSTFLPHTSQKACLFVGERRPAMLPALPGDEEVIFFVSERSGKDSKGRLIIRSPAIDGGDPWDRVDHDLAEATVALRQAAWGARA